MGDDKKQALDKMDPPFQGLYFMHQDEGVYHCKSCGAALFSSEDKIHTGSGWPSFDGAKEDAVKLKKGDAARGQEVYCSQCDSFLGILIKGENFTEKKKRYDINSTALKFKASM
jgi:peptide methionine sulfoxide reductase MsrB